MYNGVLRYKPKRRGFDSRWGYWDFSLTSGRTMALGSTQPLTEMSTRGTGGRCLGLITLPPSCAVCLEILGASTSWSPVQARTGIAFTFTLRILLI